MICPLRNCSLGVMSYDIVLWGGTSSEDPNEIWARLCGGERVDGITPLAAADLVREFTSAFGAKVRVHDGVLEGPGFELGLEEGALYVQISCAWTLLESDAGHRVLAHIEDAAKRLGAHVFNPQLATRPATAKPAARGDLAQLGAGRVVSYARPGDDRAQSFAKVEIFEVRGHGEPGGAQSIFLDSAGGIYSARDDRHPTRLTDVVCQYVRLVQDALPFELFVVHGQGRQQDGSPSTFGSRILSIFDGAFGFVDSPRSTHGAPEDGAITSIWSGLQFSTTGPTASRLGPTTDLTAIVAKAARDALEAAQRGDTRRLRDWMVLLASIDTDGRGTEELRREDMPATGEHACAFEVFDAGAVMPIWAQFLGSGAFHVEARLRLPEPGGFTMKLVRTDTNAPVRHKLPYPLGA